MDFVESYQVNTQQLEHQKRYYSQLKKIRVSEGEWDSAFESNLTEYQVTRAKRISMESDHNTLQLSNHSTLCHHPEDLMTVTLRDTMPEELQLIAETVALKSLVANQP